MHLEYIVSFSSELLQEREREAEEKSMQEENGKLFCPGLTKTILNQIFRNGGNASLDGLNERPRQRPPQWIVEY